MSISFNQSIYIVNENERLVEVVLVLSNSAEIDIIVQVGTNDKTATGEHLISINIIIISNDITGGGDDYNSGPYNVTFPVGVTSVSFNITINNDNVLEYNETFSLFITEELLLKNILLGEFNTTEVVIVNDGTSGEYALILIINNIYMKIKEQITKPHYCNA